MASTEEATFTKDIVMHGRGGVYPQYGDTVFVHYNLAVKSTTARVVASTYRTGRAFSFEVGMHQVMRGLDDGVCSMQEHELCTMEIGHKHAFGEAGLEGVVPPRSDMILQVELLKVERSSWYSCAIL